MKKHICKDCTKRYLGCHDKCEEYQSIKNENANERRKIKNEYAINQIVKDLNFSTKNHNINKKYR